MKDFLKNWGLLSGFISALLTIGILIGVYQTKINYLTDDAAKKDAKISELEKKDQENYDKLFNYIWGNKESIAVLTAIRRIESSQE